MKNIKRTQKDLELILKKYKTGSIKKRLGIQLKTMKNKRD
jgi:hypothetical protein